MQTNGTNATINQVMEVLTKHGATCIPDVSSEQSLYVNHTKVLVRKTYAPNDCVCVELMHEVVGCKWVKSWGLTSEAQWLLHIDHEDVHWWFHLPTLLLMVRDKVIKDGIELRNNSLRTRARNGVTSNVLSVWVNKLDECDFIFNGTQDYTWFMNNMKRDTL